MLFKESPRANWQLPTVGPVRGAVVLLFFICLSCFIQKVSAQEGKLVTNETGDMECVSYCSAARPGISLMEVKWQLADHPLNNADLNAKASHQGLDATVFSEGFERGLYVTISALKPTALFRVPAKPGENASALQSTSKLPGLDKLMVADVSTRLNKPTTPMRLLLLHPPAANKEWQVVRVEGLNPGMEYSFRVSAGKSMVACQAAVCPIDAIPTPPATTAKPTVPQPPK